QRTGSDGSGQCRSPGPGGPTGAPPYPNGSLSPATRDRLRRALLRLAAHAPSRPGGLGPPPRAAPHRRLLAPARPPPALCAPPPPASPAPPPPAPRPPRPPAPTAPPASATPTTPPRDPKAGRPACPTSCRCAPSTT